MHRTAHISQGFKQGLRIGCEGSQMTSGLSFLLVTKEMWFLILLGHSPQWKLAGDGFSFSKMHIPPNFCIQFQGVWGSPPPIQGFQVQNPRIGQFLSFLTTPKKKKTKKQKTKPLRTIIIPYIQRRFTVYKALSIPQTLMEKEETEAQINYRVTCLRSLGQLVVRPGSKPSSSDSGACLSTPERPPALPPLTKAA